MGEGAAEVYRLAPATVSIVGGIELSIVVPTFNERDNLRETIDQVEAALPDVAWEILFVDDDSPDGTADLAREIAGRDRRVRVLRRIGRRGLASACIEGILASAGPIVAVMDADLQHDPALLPHMLGALRAGRADLVVGSRYVAGGGIGAWSAERAWISRIATRLGQSVLPAPLSDPMSGFFMLRREVFEAARPRLSGLGFKILLDIVASAPEPPRTLELPYQFRQRHAGASKLDGQVAIDYLMLLVDKRIGCILPTHLVSATAQGAIGLLVHFGVLAGLYRGFGVDFVIAHLIAGLVVLSVLFTSKNLLTYRDRRLVGRSWLKGWLARVLIGGPGLAAGTALAGQLYVAGTAWPMATLAGVLVAAIWNVAAANVAARMRPRPD